MTAAVAALPEQEEQDEVAKKGLNSEREQREALEKSYTTTTTTTATTTLDGNELLATLTEMVSLLGNKVDVMSKELEAQTTMIKELQAVFIVNNENGNGNDGGGGKRR
jgi:hypothetical protein